MKCFLHIGTEKTGTTILQNWLYDNKDELSQSGIFLSDRLGLPNNRLISRHFQTPPENASKKRGMADENKKRKRFSEFSNRFEKVVESAKSTHHSFVITSEHLHSRVITADAINRLHSFLSRFFDEIEVICYFRDQFDVAVSLYSTANKIQNSSDVNSFVDEATPQNYYYNYLQIADNWSAVFGKQNCNFRIYDRARFLDNDIRKDFLSIISHEIDFNTLKMERQSSNESLFALQGEAYRVINQNIPYRNRQTREINEANIAAKRQIQSLDALKIGRIASPLGDTIRARFTEVNTMFFEKYFDGVREFPHTPVEVSENVTLEQAKKAVGASIEFGLNFQPSLSEEDIDAIIDIAMAIDDRRTLSKKDALTLMKMASKLRPDEPQINQKLAKWSSDQKVKMENE